MDITAVPREALIGVASGLGGMLVTILTQHIQSRRGLLTYFVNHNRVGVSTDDAIFGSVRVTWNGNPVANLYSSSVELINHSMQDYENISLRAFSNDTELLTEKTEVLGTSRILAWTPDFARQLHIEAGAQPTSDQVTLYRRSRDYLIPVLNRGQVVRLHFLNAAKTQNPPTIWLDVLHKGVKLEFRVPQPEIFGVSAEKASLAGIALGFILVGIVISFVQTLWIAVLISLVFGFCAQAPGALTVKAWRSFRNAFGG